MEKGQLKIEGSRGVSIKWTSDIELKKQGFLNRLLRKSIKIEINGLLSCKRESWYCQHCNKVFSDFDVREYEEPTNLEYEKLRHKYEAAKS